MGFWHTGYIDIPGIDHEPSGLSGRYKPSPPEFPCAYCDKIYLSTDELRKHRLESHPLHRPALFVQGRELGAHPIRITRRLTEADVEANSFDRAFLNGDEIPICAISRKLARISSDVCQLVLSKADVSTTFTLDFRIASEEDLKGVETQFEKMVLGRRLDIRAIDEFISVASGFETAIGYCDGICAYLYGVLTKESSPGSTLPHESYVRKFNKSASELAAYERPLARVIGSLVEFHFNHFEEATRLASKARVGHAAGKHTAWLQGGKMRTKPGVASNFAFSGLEALVADRDTEQIIRWTICPFGALSESVRDIESFLRRDSEEYDKVKLHVLLSEFYAASGDVGNKLRHAKALRNLPALEAWAESMIRTHSRNH